MRKVISALFLLLVVLLPSSLRAQALLTTNGLVAYYPFDGNLQDASGNNANGSFVGSVTYTAGISGSALSLADTNYIQIPDEPWLNFGPGADFAISAWIKPQFASTAFGEMDIVDKRFFPEPHPNLSQALGYEFVLLNGQVYCQLAPAPGDAFETFGPGGPDLRDGQFHWVAMSITRTSTTGGVFYVDGKPVLTFDPTGAAGDLSNSVPLLVGHNTEIDGGFTGAIDELRIYNRALSANEAAQIYASGEPPHTALATATIFNPFVVGVSLTDPGSGYTNTPAVRFIGGGGSGAQAVAVVSNGVVTDINMIAAGSGYTNTPVVVIDPPFSSNPQLKIAPAALLSFNNLAVGTNYQFQRFTTSWLNQAGIFTASNKLFTQVVQGFPAAQDYRLAVAPLPVQAAAVPQVVNGFVVGVQVTVPGSGYVTPPAVTIVSAIGSNATAVATIGSGRVTGITITSAGIGYRGTVTIRIDPPPVQVLFPTAYPGVRLDASSLAPYDNYQIQYTADLTGSWSNWPTGLFSPTDTTNSQLIFPASGDAFFRLHFVP